MQFLGLAIAQVTPSEYTITFNDMSGDGTITIAVSTSSDVEDLDGNPLESSVTSAALTIDNTEPTVVVIAPARQVTGNISVSASVTSPGDSLTGSQLYYSIDQFNYQLAGSIASGNASVSIPSEAIVWFYVTASDAAGNTRTTPASGEAPDAITVYNDEVNGAITLDVSFEDNPQDFPMTANSYVTIDPVNLVTPGTITITIQRVPAPLPRLPDRTSRSSSPSTSSSPRRPPLLRAPSTSRGITTPRATTGWRVRSTRCTSTRAAAW
ncbi:MAG: hypothetical protein HC888_16775 [Candidatus Competibacteraceae bacterium]|nr:hypothetical protein [Candidatus Competibacteraceae bacterium]